MKSRAVRATYPRHEIVARRAHILTMPNGNRLHKRWLLLRVDDSTFLAVFCASGNALSPSTYSYPHPCIDVPIKMAPRAQGLALIVVGVTCLDCRWCLVP